MEINIDEIVPMLEVLVDSAKKSGVSVLEIEEDWYLHLLSKDRESFDTMKPKLGVGSLVDDINGLRDMESGEYMPTPLDFERLASVLVSIAKVIKKSKILLF